MASIVEIARDNEKAKKQLEEAIPIIAKKLGLDVPNLSVHKKYALEYRRAKEMLAISDFFMQIAKSIQSKPKRKRKATK